MQKSLDASICWKEVNIPVGYSGVQWEQPRRPDQQGLWQAGYRAGQGGHFPDKLTNTQTDRQTNKKPGKVGLLESIWIICIFSHVEERWQTIFNVCVQVVTKKFSNLETCVEIGESVRGEDVYIIQVQYLCSVQPNMGKLDQFKPTWEDVYIIQVQYLYNQVIMCKQVQYVQTGTIRVT